MAQRVLVVDLGIDATNEDIIDHREREKGTVYF